MNYKPYPYQEFAEQHIIKYRGTGLFMEMGLGKTVATLTAVVELLRTKQVKKVIVIAPLKVARDVWTNEIEKWDHLRHLRVAKILGTPVQRQQALLMKADIWVVNRENIPWLVALFGGLGWPFDMTIIDELSSFKSAKSRRFKALRMVLSKVNKIVGLTGTPRPNSLLDLWSQLYLLDSGQRLGQTLGQYRNKYFTPAQTNGHIVYSYALRKGEDLIGKEIYEKEVYDKISDICISMKAKDYIQLPEKIIVNRMINLPVDIKEQYDKFEMEQVLAINDKELTAANAAVLTGKLLQFSNGAVYDENKEWEVVHDEKLDALEEIIEEGDGQPVLIFYSFKHDLVRIKNRIKQTREMKTNQDMLDWNAGGIKVMACHPGSAGHGLNLQAGGNLIVWFGVNWSLELYLQANARLHRQGQLKPVIIHHLLCAGTMDMDVMRVLMNKEQGQNGMMQALRARIEKYKKLFL